MSTKHPEVSVGVYCYDERGVCPHWSMDPEHEHQENGYCDLLELGDWMEEGTILLWDQCKECSINEYDEREDFHGNVYLSNGGNDSV